MSSILIVLLVCTIAFVAVNHYQLAGMTSRSASIDGAQHHVVLAYEGLMDTDQGVYRYALDHSASSLQHLHSGSERFLRNVATIEQFATVHHLSAAAAAARDARAAYARWYRFYAARSLQGRGSRAELAAADRLSDVTQADVARLDHVLAAARRAQVDSVHRQGSLSQIFIGAAIVMFAATGVIVDYKRRRENAAYMTTLNERAAALERSNAALQDFAYVASHDLQEPLRMVSSYTQLLARRYKGKLDADADDFIGFAVDGAKRMQILIRDILEYSRVDSGDGLGPVTIRDAYDDAIANLSGSIADSAADVSAGALPRVMGDQRQLEQLLQNLIGNALKYRGGAAPSVRVEAERQGDIVRFAVRDNGIGIEAEYYERIFRMFQRLHAKSEYSGTGIGLAICKRIVERHGGRMWVASTPGAGSTFFFTLRAA